MNAQLLTLNAMAGIWFAAMLRATIQGGFALALVWLIVRLLPKITPVTQCWLWRLAYLKLIVAFVWSTPVLLPILPPVQHTVAVQQSPTRQIAANDPIQKPGSVAVTQPTSAPQALSQLSQRQHSPAILAAQAKPVVQAPVLSPIAWAMAIWCVALAGFASFLILQWRTALRIYRSSYPLQQGELITACALLSHRMGLKHIPWLMAWKGGDTPLVLGGLKPVILIPEALLNDCGPAELELMLAHELGHISRRDLLWAWLPLLGRILFWFNPLVWIGLRELSTAQEMDSDALALSVTLAPAAEYGSLLLRVASCRRSDARSELVMVGMAESYQTLKRRLIAMKSNSFTTSGGFGIKGTTLLTLAAVSIVPWQVSAQTGKSRPAATRSEGGLQQPQLSTPLASGLLQEGNGATLSAGTANNSAAISQKPGNSAAFLSSPQTNSGGQSSGSSSSQSGGQAFGTSGGQSSGSSSGQSSGSTGGQSSSSSSGGGSSSTFVSGGSPGPTVNLEQPLQAAAGKYTVYLDRTSLTNLPGGRSSVSFSANGVRFSPNVQITLRVTAPTAADLQQIAGISPQAVAIELSGAEAKKSPIAQPMMVPIIDDAFHGTLFVKVADTTAKGLKSLEGTLMVREGKPTRLELAGNELRSGTQKRVGELGVTVESYHNNGDNIEVELSVVRPSHRMDLLSVAQDPQRLHEMMMQNMQNMQAGPGVEVTLLDQNKHTIRPNSMSMGSASGGGASGASGGFSSGGSFSSSGGSNGQFNSNSGQNSNEGQNSNFSRSGDGMDKQTIHLTFPAPAEGAPAALVVTVANKTGKTVLIPFKFTNIPLPGSR
jgi:beta-lactamase regulating signal transducer with metallopeptidase domain